MLHRPSPIPPERLAELINLDVISERQRQMLEIGTLLDRVDTSISNLMEIYATRFGMSRLESSALQTALLLGNDATLKTIGQHIHATPSTMTGVAARLEDAGLAHRKKSPGDGRAWILVPTEMGQERAIKMFREFFAGITSLADTFDDQSIADLLLTFRTFVTLADDFTAKVHEEEVMTANT